MTIGYIYLIHLCRYREHVHWNRELAANVLMSMFPQIALNKVRIIMKNNMCFILVTQLHMQLILFVRST